MLALPLVAALVGSPRTGPLTLNLGPGDGPFVSGFAPEYEIYDKVATHWTAYDASVRLPLKVSGEAELSYRFARVLPETAVVVVSFAGRQVDQFTCRGGLVQERQVALGRLDGSAVAVDFHVDSHDRRNLGLRLDWVRLQLGPGAHTRLLGAAAWRGVLVLVVLGALLVAAGWSPVRAPFLLLPWTAAGVLGLLVDPWITYRLLRGVPLALALAGAVGVDLGRTLVRSRRADPASLRILVVLGSTAFLIRALAVNHPDFYYPDLKTHASLVALVQEGGLDFLRSPSSYIWKQGLWRIEAYGRTYAFPYSPAFHVPFALMDLGHDSLVTAMKLTAAALTVVPLVLVWAMARRLEASRMAAAFAAVLMVVIPTYTSRLSYAFLAALFGHAFDIAFVRWLMGHLERLGEPRVWLTGALMVSLCQLAYISGVMNVCLLVVCLAALLVWPGVGDRSRSAFRVLGLGLAGSALSVLVYYRDFLGMAFDLLPRVVAGGSGLSRYPVQGWLFVTYSRTWDFFGLVYPLLTLLGLWLIGRPCSAAERARRRASAIVVCSWAAAYLLLLLGRAKVPDVFLHGHETLFVTPLVCLAAGLALAWLWAGSPARRVAAGLLFAFLVVQGFRLQWLALVAQTANAR